MEHPCRTICTYLGSFVVDNRLSQDTTKIEIIGIYSESLMETNVYRVFNLVGFVQRS